MIKVTLDYEMKISGDVEDLKILAPVIRKSLTFNNPEYVAAKRIGRWVPRELYVNRFLQAYSFRNGIIHLPRSFWQRLKVVCDDKGIKYRVKDHMTSNPSPVKFKYVDFTDLRPYQKKAAKAAIKYQSGVIEAPCGSGKTQILTEIIRRAGQWSLILVHTDDLLNQMKTRLEKAFGIEVGIVKQKTMIIRPITVASVMTLRRRKLSQKFLRIWGLVALDESHHMPAASFTEVIRQFPARLRLGTTATGKRGDNLHGLMYATIGYRIYSITYKELYEGGWLMPADVYPVDTEFEFEATRRNYHKLLEKITTDYERNKLIVDGLYRQRDHYNLVLSSRIEHLEILYKMLLEIEPSLEERAELLTGRRTRKERDDVLWQMNNGNINYIFATQLADEGLDLPVLDRLHLVFPTRSESKIQQQLGRIQRTHPDKVDARAYDYTDVYVPMLLNQSEHRLSVYRRTGCRVHMPKNRNIPEFITFGAPNAA